MSILRSKHSGWTWEGRRTPFGGGSGGGGGGQPTQSTSYQTNVPEYAKPYVETMLGAAQKQAYKYDDAGNVVGFQPYIPYGATVGPGGQITNTAQEQAAAAVAPFSPMQERAFQQTAGLRVPSQYGIGSQFAGAGGMGAANIAQQAAGIGGQYYGMATNPYAQQSFMSPYMQNVVDVQKAEAIRDYGKILPGMQAQATRAGAFGGSRQAIEQAEARRNLGTQLGQIQAQGTQRAFEQAQQAQQFGANLGLQGYGTALQGTGQLTSAGKALADIGGAQLQAQQGIIGLQSQAGAQQQALEQQKVNQAIQNYALQQQNPQMQLSLMSSLLRGLPLQQATTQTYQAPPSALSQIGGLGAAGVGLYGMGRSAGIFGKEGGHVRKLASGGITGMSKKVLLNPEDFSTDQVKTMTDKGMISRLVGAPILDAKMKDEQRMKLAQAAQQPKPIDTIAADIMARAAANQGIDNAESNLPVMSAFDGGIVAMADGGEVDSDGIARFQTGGGSTYIDKDDEGYYLPGAPTSQFGRDIRGAKDFYKRKIAENILQPLADIRGYFSDKAVVPSAAPATAPVEAPPEAPKPRILEDSKPSAAAPAASAPSVADTGGRGINDILKRFEETLGKGEQRDTEAKKMAFWSSLAQLGFGAMGGTSRSGLTNIGQAGAPAVASGMQQLRDIEGRQEKRGLAQLQAALEGEKLKAEYTKLGMMQPYYKEYANYLARRQGSTGTAGLGSVPFGEFRKIKAQYDGYLMDGKTVRASPIAKYLTPDELNALKASPGTPSYERGMARAAEVAKQRMDAELREGMQYTAKQRVGSSAEEI
jgi:hypothetical protein